MKNYDMIRRFDLSGSISPKPSPKAKTTSEPRMPWDKLVNSVEMFYFFSNPLNESRKFDAKRIKVHGNNVLEVVNAENTTSGFLVRRQGTGRAWKRRESPVYVTIPSHHRGKVATTITELLDDYSTDADMQTDLTRRVREVVEDAFKMERKKGSGR